MPQIDLSILNQRQTPAFYADVLANRPAAGFIGRIFVSTNTFEFYRDNGTGWDLIGGPGAGTITGSGAAGQVSFWNGASTITGSNDLFWDNVNGHLGIGTITPGTALSIAHDQNQVVQLNQTTATNDTKIAFQNSGTALWRIGNSYGGGTNRFVVTDAALNINRFSVLPTSGQTFVGDVVTSSGLFVVNSSSGDAHIVALGATAPSIRVRNAGTGATLQFGLGLATTTNNFIQGSTGGEFCIFNDSLTAQPILFGIKDAGSGNTLEAARISAARNFIIGGTVDAGFKLDVVGTIRSSGIIYGGVFTPGAGLQATDLFATNGRVRATGGITFRTPTANDNASIGVFPDGGSGGAGVDIFAANQRVFNFSWLGNSAGNAFKIFQSYTTVVASGNINTFDITPNINASFPTSVIYTGINYNPTITNLNGGTHRAFVNTSGDNVFNSSSGSTLIGITTNAGFKLDVNGTARVVNTLTVGSNGVAAGRIELSRAAATPSGFLYMSGNTMIIENASTFIEFRPGSVASAAIIYSSGNTVLTSTGLPATDNASALLTMNSITKGFLPPRMTTAQKNAIGTPATGLVLYDTTLNKLCVFTGVNWETVTSV
jgi:hypothetical protein